MTTCPDCQLAFEPTQVPSGQCPRCLILGGRDNDQETLRAPLPDCEIVGLIAHGGMGNVYRATQPTLERELAVKVMTAQAETPELADRFRREALVLARLQHPNIVPIHALGTDEDGQPYYTMKLVKGRTLQAILDGLRQGDAATLRQDSLLSLLGAFRKVCDALAFAHAQGVLHRDLKPDNIMIGEFGEVLVMDWGLARMQDKETGLRSREAKQGEDETSEPAFSQSPSLLVSASGLTLQGSVMGTPQYMSPEQAMGQVRELDERSDIYSLGCILYAILTLKAPVEGGTVQEILDKVRTHNITPPSMQASALKGALPPRHLSGRQIPAALSSVAMKALRLDKAERYPSVEALIADVEAYQGGFATAAENAGAWQQLMLLMRRHRTVTVSLAVLLALSVGFVLKLMSSEESARASKAVAVEEKAAARQALAKTALTLAEAELRDGSGVMTRSALETVPEDLRDATWHYLLGQSDSSSAHLGKGQGVAAHPRLPGVFAATHNSKVILRDVRRDTTLLEFDVDPGQRTKNNLLLLAFAPDGESLAVSNQRWSGIVVYRTSDGTKLRDLDVPATARFSFSPDGRHLLLVGQIGRGLTVCDSQTGSVVWALADQPQAKVNFGAYTPDGEQVLTVGERGEMRVLNALDGTPVRTIPIGREAGVMLAVSSTGLVALADKASFVLCFDLGTGRVLAEFQTPTPDRFNVTRGDFLGFTAAGDQIVTAQCRSDGAQDIRVWDARTGRSLRPLLGGSGLLREVALHPVSGELLVTGEDSRVWNLAPVPVRWQLPTDGSPDLSFWGSDDRIFVSGHVIKAQLQTLASGSPVRLWSSSASRSLGGTVSVDGRFAAFSELSGRGVPEVVVLRQPGPGVEQASRFPAPGKDSVLRLSPTGDRLACGSSNQKTFAVLASMGGKRLATLALEDLKQISDFGWVSGGDRLVGLTTAMAVRGLRGSEERLVLWDATTGKILQTATNPTATDVLAVAPDGRRFAEAGADKRVRIRDAATLAVLQEFRAHNEAITSLAWHPTLPILATGSGDLSVKLWNLDSGECLREFRGPLTAPIRLAFSPSGRRLGAASAHDAVRVWETEAPAATPLDPR